MVVPLGYLKIFLAVPYCRLSLLPPPGALLLGSSRDKVEIRKAPSSSESISQVALSHALSTHDVVTTQKSPTMPHASQETQRMWKQSTIAAIQSTSSHRMKCGRESCRDEKRHNFIWIRSKNGMMNWASRASLILIAIIRLSAFQITSVILK